MHIGILGYGNLGRALEIAASADGEISSVTLFTAREPSTVTPHLKTPVYHESELCEYAGVLDLLFLAHGSGSRVPTEAPRLLKEFDTVDCYDAHADLPRHLSACHEAARLSGHIGLVGAGWDPGLLSVMRVCFRAAFPKASLNTFWGRGVSQGHSEVLRTIRGVKRAVEYTVPKESAKILAHRGVTLSDTERHRRVCYIVPILDTERERERIRREIRQIPIYFEGYDTEIYFTDEDTFEREHKALSHRGEVIARALGGAYETEGTTLSFRLEADSNPTLTAHLMLAYGKALLRMKGEGGRGAFTPLDVPPSMLLPDFLRYF